MYKCSHCGEIFPTPDLKEVFTGVEIVEGGKHWEEVFGVDICPYCETEEPEKVFECKCGAYSEDIVCPDCVDALLDETRERINEMVETDEQKEFLTERIAEELR